MAKLSLLFLINLFITIIINTEELLIAILFRKRKETTLILGTSENLKKYYNTTLN